MVVALNPLWWFYGALYIWILLLLLLRQVCQVFMIIIEYYGARVEKNNRSKFIYDDKRLQQHAPWVFFGRKGDWKTLLLIHIYVRELIAFGKFENHLWRKLDSSTGRGDTCLYCHQYSGGERDFPLFFIAFSSTFICSSSLTYKSS